MYSAILSTFIKLPFVIKILVLSIFSGRFTLAAADLDFFLFDYMLSLSDNSQTDIIEAFNSTSRYFDDLINIDNPYFEQRSDISHLSSVK